MLLYLIRHAEAEPLTTPGIARDFDRPLTPRGHAHSQKLAEAFTRLQISVDTVTASPLVRAHQSAVELLQVWQPGNRPVTCDELGLERLKPVKLSEFLANVQPRGLRTPSRDEKSVAAVGHMPDLGVYLEWLIGAAPGTIALAKAAAACLRFRGEPGKATGELLWLITPPWYT